MTCNPDDDTDCDRNDPSSSGHDNLGQKFCGRRETLVGDINTGDEGEETMSLYMCVCVFWTAVRQHIWSITRDV